MTKLLSSLAEYATWITAIVTCFVLLYKPAREAIMRPFRSMRNRMIRKKEFENSCIETTKTMKTVIDRLDSMDARFDSIDRQMKKSDKDSVEDSICVLRHSIVDVYDRYQDKDEVPYYVKKNLEEMFQRYTIKGGNWYVHDCYDEIMSKRTKE